VATSPDPEDPENVLREVESKVERERHVDARLDPYGSRYRPREARTEALAGLIRNERMVEEIVRSRTWGLVSERCVGGEEKWQDALDDWRRRKEMDEETDWNFRKASKQRAVEVVTAR
jgi:hypothetical protein